MLFSRDQGIIYPSIYTLTSKKGDCANGLSNAERLLKAEGLLKAEILLPILVLSDGFISTTNPNPRNIEP